jgi:lipid-binding SYLF domain-containing protein
VSAWLIIVPFSTGECKKAGKILASFIDPRQAFGPDKIIPPEILAGAKVSEKSKSYHKSVC